MLPDLSRACATLRRSPGFALASIATLALGIGANTAIFTLLNATLLAPLPFPDAQRIVQVWFTSPNGGGSNLSIPECNLLARKSRIFAEFAAYDFGGPGVNLTGDGDPEQVPAIHASAGYFHLFGAHAEFGRVFTAEEDRPEGGRVVAISHALWLRRFHADPTLVGHAISLGDEPYRVVGILSADFRPDPAADIWFPLQADPESTGHANYVRAAARLAPGVSFDRGNAALKLAYAEYRRRFPLINPRGNFEARPIRETSVGGIRSPLLILFGTVLLVLLIACSNVANLLLARGAARSRELAIRAALGASRSRLAAQLLTESLLLALAGAAAGILAGEAALRAMLVLNPEAVPPGASISLDGRVLAFAIGLTLLSTLLFGLLPALRGSRADLARAMEAGGVRAGAGRGEARAKSFLVVLEVALSVVLVVSAGLMLRTFAALRQVSPGFDPDGVITAQMSLAGTRFHDTAAVAALVENGVLRLQQIPGVTAAAQSWMLPMEAAFGSSFIIEGRPLAGSVVHGGALMRPVSPAYSAVFRIPVLRGRFFTDRDTASAPSVAIISEAMARQFWPEGNPIGERLTLDKYLGPDFNAPPREIIGVVGDVHDSGLNQAPGPLIYVPEAQAPNGMTRIDVGVLPMTWAIRTSVPGYAVRGAVRRALEEASGGLAVARVRTMREVIGTSTAQGDFDTLLLAGFAAASLLLAAIGIYGLMAFAMEQRRREIGIRLALGATPDAVRRMMLLQGLRLAMIGVTIGSAASLWLARFLRTLLYGVKPVDPVVIAASCALLAAVAVAACYLPARRASKADPAEALRSA